MVARGCGPVYTDCIINVSFDKDGLRVNQNRSEMIGGTYNKSPRDAVLSTTVLYKPVITDAMVAQWQEIVDLIAIICTVPAALVMKVHPSEIEVFVRADAEGNPYERGEKAELGIGLYCETVMTERRELLVPNALEDPKWDHNPDIKLNMISYLGLPLLWPDGDVFGTVCILDSKENSYTEDIRNLMAKFRTTIETSLTLLCEIQARKKAQAELESKVGELKTINSQVEQLNSAMRNVVEDLRASKETLEMTTRELADANEELESFSYSVSHDLRAPLRAIDGFSKMLVEDYGDKLDENGQHQLDVIRSSARDMGQLIDDLLAFSRLGRKEMSRLEFDMAALVREVYKKLQLAETQPTTRLDVKALPRAFGDQAMIREVVANLLSNAFKFTTGTEDPSIVVGCTVEGNENIYCVKDNGVGFDMKYKDKLFRVFQRLHSAEEFPGTGIGLALVQRIVHRHGGRVWAEGKVNEGASVYFTLPRGKEEEDA